MVGEGKPEISHALDYKMTKDSRPQVSLSNEGHVAVAFPESFKFLFILGEFGHASPEAFFIELLNFLGGVKECHGIFDRQYKRRLSIHQIDPACDDGTAAVVSFDVELRHSDGSDKNLCGHTIC